MRFERLSDAAPPRDRSSYMSREFAPHSAYLGTEVPHGDMGCSKTEPLRLMPSLIPSAGHPRRQRRGIIEAGPLPSQCTFPFRAIRVDNDAASLKLNATPRFEPHF